MSTSIIEAQESDEAYQYVLGSFDSTITRFTDPKIVISDLVKDVYGSSERIMKCYKEERGVTVLKSRKNPPTQIWRGTTARNLSTHIYGARVGYAICEHFDLKECEHKTVNTEHLMRVLAFFLAEMGQQCVAVATGIVSKHGDYSLTRCRKLPAFQMFAEDMRAIIRRAI